MSTQNNPKNKGFTLVELLVVCGIIIILSSLVVPGYRVGGQQFALQRSAHKLAQDLRRVEEMAMGIVKVGYGIVPSGEEFAGDTFGIHFDPAKPTKYVLFVDCDFDKKYTLGNTCFPPGHPEYSFPELLEEVFLESKVEIGPLSPVSPLDIAFESPWPIIYIPNDQSEAKITLFLTTASSKTMTITVNEAGLIFVE